MPAEDFLRSLGLTVDPEPAKSVQAPESPSPATPITPEPSLASKLYPFLHKSVMTPQGIGTLVQAFSSRCSVAFESDPDHVKFFKPEEITPIEEPPF